MCIKQGPCNECINTNDSDLFCRRCLDMRSEKEIKDYYFADKYRIEALIEEAEKRHREKGGLVVCDSVDECECQHMIPHIYDDDHLFPCSRNCKNTETAKCIAFRGESTNEEEAQEYVIVKDISMESLSDNDEIDADFYLNFSRDFFDRYDAENCIGVDTKVIFGSFPYDYHVELERLNFIEKVVHDPVVEPGDSFVGLNGYYQAVSCLSDTYTLVNICGHDHYAAIKTEFKMKLSHLVGKNKIKDFKPVEIKITEV